jgi:hypothetical protein
VSPANWALEKKKCKPAKIVFSESSNSIHAEELHYGFFFFLPCLFTAKVFFFTVTLVSGACYYPENKTMYPLDCYQVVGTFPYAYAIEIGCSTCTLIVKSSST